MMKETAMRTKNEMYNVTENTVCPLTVHFLDLPLRKVDNGRRHYQHAKYSVYAQYQKSRQTTESQSPVIHIKCHPGLALRSVSVSHRLVADGDVPCHLQTTEYCAHLCTNFARFLNCIAAHCLVRCSLYVQGLALRV